MRYLVSLVLFFGLVATSFGDNYGQRGVSKDFGTNQEVFRQERKIFFNDTYFFGQNGFFDVGENARLLNLENAFHGVRRENDTLREQLRLLDNKLNLIQQSLQSLGGKDGDGVGGGLISPELFDFGPEPQDAAVTNIFKQNCADCHTEGDASKITLLSSDGALVKFTTNQLQRIYDRTVLTPDVLKQRGLNAMPKGEPRLSLTDRNAIRTWASSY